MPAYTLKKSVQSWIYRVRGPVSPLFVAAVLTGSLPHTHGQTAGSKGDWNTNASANWTAGPWTGLDAGTNYPSGVGAVADVVQDVNATRTITLDIPITLGTLRLGDTNNTNAFVIGGVLSTNVLTFDNNGLGAVLDHDVGNVFGGPNKSPSGSDRIDAPVILADDLTIRAERNIEFRGAWDAGGNDITLVSSGRAYWNNNNVATSVGTLTNANVLNILNGEARFDGIAGTADTGLIGVNTINLGDGFGTTGGTGFRVFPRLFVVNSEATQTAALNVNGGWLVIDLGTLVPVNSDGQDIWSGNITFTGAASTNIFDVNDAGAPPAAPEVSYVSGTISGAGGFSKVNTGSLNLLAANPIQGNIYVQRGGPGGAALASKGSLALSGANGALADVNSLTISRDGSFYLQNDVDVNNNRVADDASIILRGAGRIRMVGNAVSAASETMGMLHIDNGSGKVNFDLNDATPQSTTLSFATFSRDPGAIAQFQVLDNTPGAFGANARLYVLDGGASSQVFGGGTGNGTTTQSIVVGALGGVNNVSNHFMTFDSADANQLRPLDFTTEYLLTQNLPTRHVIDENYTATYGVSQNLMLNYNVERLGDPDGDVNWYGDRPNRMTTHVAVNSLRFGTNTPTSTANSNNTNEIGSVLSMDAGVVLYLGDSLAANNGLGQNTNGSGMVLFGRDIDGTAPGSNQFITGGILDFGSREAIFVNESGNSAFIRSEIRGSGGFTKAGAQTLYLDNSNTYSGTTTIAEGILDIRDQNALGSSNLVQIDGSGQLYLELGTIVAGAPKLVVGPGDASRTVLRSNAGNNTWSGDVVIDTTDNLGNWVFTSYINTAARDILNINGNIYSNKLLHPINTDITLNDARLISTISQDAAGGIINLNGQFRDNANGSVGAVVTPDNENQLLRFQIRGSDELVVNVRQQWDAAGRILLEQGYLRYEGEGNFWTDGAAASITQTNAQSGMRLSGAVTANNGVEDIALILTKPGQVLNINRLDIGGDGTNNWNARGNITLAGTNTSGTVTFGLGNERIVYNGASTANQYIRDLSMYAAGGGTVDLNFRLDDASTAMHSSFTKIGRGVVNYNSRNGTEAGDLEQVNLSGGLLRLTNYAAATGIRVDNGALIVFAGGGIEMDGVGSTSNRIENFTGVAATDAVLAGVRNTGVLAGGTDVIVTSTTGRTTTMNIGDPTTGLVRASGGTLHFVENGNGGTSVITFEATSGLAPDAVIPWATYGDSYTFDAANARYSMNALDFAMVTGANGDVTVFSGANREDQDNASLWTNGRDVSESGGGFSGTTVASAAVNSIHFDFNGASTLTVDAGGLVVASGGVMVSSAVSTGASEKTIAGGGLSAASGADFVVHQYGAAPLTISSSILDNGGTALVKSGTGELVLLGTNTHAGGTHFNGGTVVISGEAQLGAVPAGVRADDLYFNGGILRTTGTTSLNINRGVTLGGNGGEISVDGGAVMTVNGLIATEPNIFAAAGYVANPAVGRLDKSGAGTLVSTTLNNTYNGLTEVKEGTFRWEPSITASVTADAFGSNDAFLDGTIVRSGATLELAARTPAVDSNLTVTNNEWFVLEGGSTLITSLFNDVANGFHDVNYNLRGVIQLNANGHAGTPAGAAVFNVARRTLSLNDDGGYLTGDGGIIKVGNSTLAFREANPEWTGQLTVNEGTVSVYSAGPVLGVGTAPILLGHNLAAEQAGEPDSGNNVAALYFRDEGGYRDVSRISQDIIVRDDTGAGSQTKRLGAYFLAHVDEVNFDGRLTLNDDLELFYQDDARDSTVPALPTVPSAANTRNDTRAYGALTNEERVFINFNGDITGSRTLVTNVVQAGNANAANGSITGLMDDLVLRPIFGLNGNNAGWTGSLTLGNNAATPDVDRIHTVSLGSDTATSAANAVTMHWDSVLQVSGNTVSIGNLSTPRGATAVNGGAPNATNGSGVFIENAAATDGTLTISQSTDAVYQAIFRDGTPFFELQPSETIGSLSLVKTGTGRSTLVTQNTYTGTTTVTQGVLQVGLGGDGTFGVGATSADVVGRNGTGTTFASGGTLAGTGYLQGGLTLNGGNVSPGDSGGADVGTLFVGNSATGGNLTALSGRIQFFINGNPDNYGVELDRFDPGYAATMSGLVASFGPADGSINSTGFGSLESSIADYDHLEIAGGITWTGGVVEVTALADLLSMGDAMDFFSGDVFNLIDWYDLGGATTSWAGFDDGASQGYLTAGGAFGNFILPDLSGLGEGFLWDTRLWKTNGVLVIVTPEPGRLILLMGGLLAIGLRRRREYTQCRQVL